MALNVGIVGAGRTGFRRARRLEAWSDVRIMAVAEPGRPTRDAFARTFGAELAVSDHRRLAAHPEVDAVYICSPPATHSAVAVDLLEVGKHVICEPPMAVNVSQAEDMMAAAESSSGRLFVALPQRYNPANQEAARLIAEDTIGYPFLALAGYLEDEFDRLNDWHDWLGSWEHGGGGILMRRGSEMVDLLLYLLGEVEAVGAVCTRFAIEPLNKAEDSCSLALELVEDATADLVLTGAARYSAWPKGYSGKAMRVEIYGLEGSIRIADSEPELIVSARGSGYRAASGSEIETALPTDMDRDFLDCILQDKDPLVTPEHAMEALRVVIAAYKASQMKRRVDTFEEL